MKLHSASRSETGPVRENNEDAVVTTDRVVVVADGMGGPPGGELASALAVSLVRVTFTGASLEELTAGVRAANWAIWDRASHHPELEGMGTTVCAVGLLTDHGVAIANVGDTRAYLLHDGRLSQLTRDHSITADLVQRGELSEEEARQHPHHGVLTRALGVGPEVVLDGAVLPAVEGDRFLLCSDGLFNEVSNQEMAALMVTNRDPAAAVDDLMDVAMSRGGRDNASVVVAEIAP